MRVCLSWSIFFAARTPMSSLPARVVFEQPPAATAEQVHAAEQVAARSGSVIDLASRQRKGIDA